MASREGGLAMGVQEENAQVEPVLPEPIPELLVVHREWGCAERGCFGRKDIRKDDGKCVK